MSEWEHTDVTITQFNRNEQKEIMKLLKSAVHTESSAVAHVR